MFFTAWTQTNIDFYSIYTGEKQKIGGKLDEVKENNQPISWVYCVCKTSDGVIWLGTMNGLLAYHGSGFKHYRAELDNKESLPSSNILHIWEEAPGILWITTSNGLAKLNEVSGKITRFAATSRFVARGQTAPCTRPPKTFTA